MKKTQANLYSLGEQSQKTMEHHHFYWVNQHHFTLSMAIFHFATCWLTKGYQFGMSYGVTSLPLRQGTSKSAPFCQAGSLEDPSGPRRGPKMGLMSPHHLGCFNQSPQMDSHLGFIYVLVGGFNMF